MRPPRSSPAAVLLDFDGTLTKPFFDWPGLRAEMNLEEGVSILDFLAREPAESARRVASILERHEIEAARRAEANSGASELLDYLRNRQIPFAVVTNNALRHVTSMIAHIGLPIQTLVTRDIGFWKPDPRHVIAGAEALGADPGRCVFIGDGRFDIEAGRAAGMTTILLSSNPAFSCDHHVKSLADAVLLLENLFSLAKKYA